MIPNDAANNGGVVADGAVHLGESAFQSSARCSAVPCTATHLIQSVFPDSLLLFPLNLVEPP